MISTRLLIGLKTELANQVKIDSELHYELNDNILTINPPYGSKEYIHILVLRSLVVLIHGKSIRRVERKLWKSNRKIINEVIAELFRLPDTVEIKPPAINKKQYSLILTNLYGQILSSGGTKFNGWGNIYHVINTVEDAFHIAGNVLLNHSLPIDGYIYNHEGKEVAEFVIS
jgi:hypothetical protein